jgi:putative iron-only hydrogenase system regulator
METRIAQIGIIIENRAVTDKLNAILHTYGDFIIGRMGLPYPKRHVWVISIIVDAPMDVISALSGKLGMLPNVNTKTIYSKVSEKYKDEV